MDITREQLTEAMKNHLGAGDGPGLEHLVSAMWRELGQGAVDQTLAQARQAVVDGNPRVAAEMFSRLDKMLGDGYPLPPIWRTHAGAGMEAGELMKIVAADLTDPDSDENELAQLVATVLRNIAAGRDPQWGLAPRSRDLLAQAMGAARTPAQQGMAALAYLARMDSGPLNEAVTAFHGGHRERLIEALQKADLPTFPPTPSRMPATEGEH